MLFSICRVLGLGFWVLGEDVFLPSPCLLLVRTSLLPDLASAKVKRIARQSHPTAGPKADYLDALLRRGQDSMFRCVLKVVSGFREPARKLKPQKPEP